MRNAPSWGFIRHRVGYLSASSPDNNSISTRSLPLSIFIF